MVHYFDTKYPKQLQTITFVTRIITQAKTKLIRLGALIEIIYSSMDLFGSGMRSSTTQNVPNENGGTQV